MSDLTGVEADPSKPYKAIFGALTAAILVALRDYFVGADAIGWPGLLAALGTALVTFVVTYVTKNPLRARHARP